MFPSSCPPLPFTPPPACSLMEVECVPLFVSRSSLRCRRMSSRADSGYAASWSRSSTPWPWPAEDQPGNTCDIWTPDVVTLTNNNQQRRGSSARTSERLPFPFPFGLLSHQPGREQPNQLRRAFILIKGLITPRVLRSNQEPTCQR